MAVFPRGLGFVPKNNPSAGVGTLEDYIRYMTDQLERALAESRTTITALEARVKALEDVTPKEVQK